MGRMSDFVRSGLRNGSGHGRMLLRYALPSVVGMLVVGLQTIIDGLFVAQGVGTLGLAAVNISMPLINVMYSVVIMVISGGVVIAGTARGRGDALLARGYTSLTLLVLLVTALLMSLAVGLNLRRVCYLLGADDVVYPFVRQYLGVIGWGFLFYSIPNYTEAFTRFAGRPNWVLVSGSICCVVNVVLDYVFVLRMGLGVRGAAVATCAANTTAALVLAPKVRLGRLAGGWREVWRMFYNGSSEMLATVSAAVSTFVFNLVLMDRVGPTGVAALTIVCYLNFIVNMSIFGLSQALYPLMSFEMGARNYVGVRSLLRAAMAISGCIGVGVYVAVALFRRPIVTAFAGGDAQLLAMATTAASIVTLHYLVSFVNITASSFHTAVERPLESVVIGLCRTIVFVLLPLAVLVPLVDETGIWLCMPVAEVLTLFVSLPLMRRTLRRIRGNCEL